MCEVVKNQPEKEQTVCRFGIWACDGAQGNPVNVAQITVVFIGFCAAD